MCPKVVETLGGIAFFESSAGFSACGWCMQWGQGRVESSSSEVSRYERRRVWWATRKRSHAGMAGVHNRWVSTVFATCNREVIVDQKRGVCPVRGAFVLYNRESRASWYTQLEMKWNEDIFVWRNFSTVHGTDDYIYLVRNMLKELDYLFVPLCLLPFSPESILRYTIKLVPVHAKHAMLKWRLHIPNAQWSGLAFRLC